MLHDTELEQSIHGNLDLGLTRARDIFGPELTFVLLLLLLLLLLHHLLLLLHLLLRSTYVRAFHIPVFGLSPLVLKGHLYNLHKCVYISVTNPLSATENCIQQFWHVRVPGNEGSGCSRCL